MSLTQSDSKLEVGDTAPDFELENYEGQNVGLTDLDNYDGVLVVFMCNHCPFVKAQTEELRKLNDEFSSIAIVGINANAETHPMDSVDKMEDFIEENDLDSEHFYYLIDGDQEVAKEYGAECTPDPFLLDWRHKLYYKGRLNDKSGPSEEVQSRDMKEAIESMLKRQDPPQEQVPSQGCNIKWKE
ncbi:thioredoxin family protein [Candidatus Nanohalococcus occultus]|uniref:thioredoxin family protein n=1 Tax=Candidatus Nanohalococcus occultus TaxID=2978047 RepID=UPI0039DF8085